ncbi:enoyl-CoA hydratase [Candidimonas sp. SYP-B2681]|uniref:enoyl-CoA hydratase n=1 Tax=Candidimonas sp. SYP-B2681 TaxID=2497686 RepID=UPI000F85D42E|nr:enoyl-CoA hydratase [Candidimonas sp. SYP-B2681]RTZ39144.1 enoyl-CoA hydratase [Candidimonas sp. SYP-B2681]
MKPSQPLFSCPENEIGYLVFDNPARHNAMSLPLWEAAERSLLEFESDPKVKAVVMRGAGEKAFVSGADISEFDTARANAKQASQYAAVSNRAREAMSLLTKPLIAMIRGYCFGAGLDIALRADIRIASECAVFCIPAARLGIAYGLESVQMLTDLVGPSVAKDILFTGRRINAQEALHLGLVNRVMPAAELEQATRDYVLTITRNAPLTIKSSKFSVNQALLDSASQDLVTARRLIADCFDSADYQEGRAAFREKRPPQFRGL